MPVSDWSTTPSANTTVGGVFIGEGCPPSNLNDAERTIMAEAKVEFNAIRAALPGGATPSSAALGGLTPAADRLPYFTGSTTAAVTPFTAFGRTLAGAADAAAVATAIGAISASASSLSTNGYLTLTIGGSPLTIQWGTSYGSYPEGQYTIPFNIAFATECFVCVPQGLTPANNNNDFVCQLISVSNGSFYFQSQKTNAGSGLTGVTWIAIGR